MRVYALVFLTAAQRVLRSGFVDQLSPEGRGVLCLERAIDLTNYPDGALLAVEGVEEELFCRHEIVRMQALLFGAPTEFYRSALIPAASLNQCGRPVLYDHAFLARGRRQVVAEIAAAKTPQMADLKERALAFLDNIGWRSGFLRYREAAPNWEDSDGDSLPHSL